MQEAKHRSEMISLVRQNASYILALGVDSTLIEEKGVIKKAKYNFSVKFLWLLLYYQLYPIVEDNMLP